MKNLKLNSCIALGAAVMFAAACSTASDSMLSPSGPAFEVAVSPQTAQICKTGPAGTYSFTATSGGNANTGDVLDDAFDITLTNDGDTECWTAFTRTVSDNVPFNGGFKDDPASIVVTEAAHAGTTLDDITAGPGAADALIDEANSKVTVFVNGYHGATATFVNKAVPVDHGCTYTQGWYKNHADQWASGDQFFTSGKTALEILKTPPKKGDVYLQLAHQYIAASQNALSASTTPEVDAALAAAKAYFETGTGDITGLAGILDDYNNGLTGPGHCD